LAESGELRAERISTIRKKTSINYTKSGGTAFSGYIKKGREKPPPEVRRI